MRFFIDIFYEPLFVVFLLGVVVILCNTKYMPQKQWARLLVILAIFMLSWRIIVAQVSTRYWVAVLFPGLIIVGYVLYLPQWGKRVSRLLTFALLLACIGKDFHLNWNNSSIINASEAIKKDAEKYSNSLVTEFVDTGLLTRIGYYANVAITDEVFNIAPHMAKDNDIDNYIDMYYQASKGLYDALYIVNECNEERHNYFLSKLNHLGVKVIFSQHKDLRRKNKIYVYRIFIPSVEEIVNYTETEIKNGDFENIKICKDKDDDTEWLYPDKWGYIKQWCPPVSVQLEQQNPISGKNSIRFLSGKEIVLGAERFEKTHQDGLILFSVKSALGATVKMNVVFFDEKGELVSQRALLNTKIPDNQLHQIRVQLRKNDLLTVKYLRVFWYVNAPNGMIMDDVFFIRDSIGK